MKIAVLALLFATTCVAAEPLILTKSDGTKITGEWLDGDDSSVTLHVKVKVPLDSLNDQSRAQAEAIATVMQNLNEVIRKNDGRIGEFAKLHRTFMTLYSERTKTPTWQERQKRLMAQVEAKILYNGSTVDACFIYLAKAIKAASTYSDRRVAKQLASVVLVLLGEKP